MIHFRLHYISKQVMLYIVITFNPFCNKVILIPYKFAKFIHNISLFLSEFLEIQIHISTNICLLGELVAEHIVYSWLTLYQTQNFDTHTILVVPRLEVEMHFWVLWYYCRNIEILYSPYHSSCLIFFSTEIKKTTLMHVRWCDLRGFICFLYIIFCQNSNWNKKNMTAQ